MVDISVKNLVKSFDSDENLLDGVTFDVQSGERVGLLGKNGAGKTTLFKILTGELDYNSGEIAFAAGKSLLRRKQWRENGLRVLWSDVDVEITNIQIDGDGAAAEAGSSLRYILEGQEPTISGEGTAYSFTLTKQDGVWRISSITADSEIDRYYDLEALRKALG